jgi:hypothetical protein
MPAAGDAANTSQAERVLVIPVTTSNWNEGGALVLGERKSEEPYTESDRNLLDGVVGAMSIAFENLRLKKRVDEGLREKREVLGRLDRDGINLLKECPACGACFDSSDGACSVDGTALAFTLPGGADSYETVSPDASNRQGRNGCGVRCYRSELEPNGGVEGDDQPPVRGRRSQPEIFVCERDAAGIRGSHFGSAMMSRGRAYHTLGGAVPALIGYYFHESSAVDLRSQETRSSGIRERQERVKELLRRAPTGARLCY